MTHTSKELKRLAREALKGHYGLLIGASIVLTLITTALIFLALIPFTILFMTIPPFAYGLYYFIIVLLYIILIIVSLLMVLMANGLTYMHLCLIRQKPIKFTDLFYTFTARPQRFIGAYFLLLLIFLVPFLPGIIIMFIGAVTGIEALPLLLLFFLFYIAGMAAIVFLSLKYAQVFILLTDHKAMGVLEAFKVSSKLMIGNKGRLFYINLSFLGLVCLSILSFYIGFLWVYPYMTQTYVNFYLDITGELSKRYNNQPAAEAEPPVQIASSSTANDVSETQHVEISAPPFHNDTATEPHSTPQIPNDSLTEESTSTPTEPSETISDKTE